MAEKQYPAPYFKDGEHPKYAHSKKDEDALLRDGWIEDYRNLPKQEFPRSVYAKDGTAVRAENQEHLDQLVDDGYSLKPIARAQEPSKKSLTESAEHSHQHNSRIDQLESDVAGMKDTLGEILAALQGGVAPTPPKAPRPPAKPRVRKPKTTGPQEQ